MLDIDKQITEYETALKDYKNQKIQLQREQWFECPKCQINHQLHTYKLIQEYWYTSPYSCTGGDYWNVGERNLVCPSCSIIIRPLTEYNRTKLYLQKNHNYEKIYPVIIHWYQEGPEIPRLYTKNPKLNKGIVRLTDKEIDDIFGVKFYHGNFVNI